MYCSINIGSKNRPARAPRPKAAPQPMTLPRINTAIPAPTVSPQKSRLKDRSARTKDSISALLRASSSACLAATNSGFAANQARDPASGSPHDGHVRAFDEIWWPQLTHFNRVDMRGSIIANPRLSAEVCKPMLTIPYAIGASAQTTDAPHPGFSGGGAQVDTLCGPISYVRAYL